MKTYFFDTSALVKRYISEIGSNWVRTVTDPEEGNGIILARITWVEMVSAYMVKTKCRLSIKRSSGPGLLGCDRKGWPITSILFVPK